MTGFRLTVDGWAQVQTGANGAKRRPDARELQPECDTFCEYLVANNALADCFRGAIEKVRTPRNRFDHAWTGAEHSITKSVRNDVEVALQDFDVAASAVEAFVRMVVTAGPELAPVGAAIRCSSTSRTTRS